MSLRRFFDAKRSGGCRPAVLLAKFTCNTYTSASRLISYEERDEELVARFFLSVVCIYFK